MYRMRGNAPKKRFIIWLLELVAWCFLWFTNNIGWIQLSFSSKKKCFTPSIPKAGQLPSARLRLGYATDMKEYTSKTRYKVSVHCKAVGRSISSCACCFRLAYYSRMITPFIACNGAVLTARATDESWLQRTLYCIRCPYNRRTDLWIHVYCHAVGAAAAAAVGFR